MSAAEIQADTTAAFDAIAARVQSRELSLKESSPIDPAKVNVVCRRRRSRKADRESSLERLVVRQRGGPVDGLLDGAA